MPTTPSVKVPLRLTLACTAIALLCPSGPAAAADCLTPARTVADGATFRATPAASGTALGRLTPGATAPFIASVPRWYETRTPGGQPAYVSKQSTEIVACPEAFTVVSAAAPGSFELHAIDVSTGVAILVRGSDFSLLYDAGTNDDLARGDGNRVLAYFRTLATTAFGAVSRIDHLLLSHPHRDHVELLPDVFRLFDVRSVWNSGAYNDICGYRHFLEAIAVEPGVQYHTVTHDTGNEAVNLGKKKCYGRDEPAHTLNLRHAARIDNAPQTLGQGASMRILHADGTKQSSFNENSLVVRLDLGLHKVLLMGDAEAGGRKAPTTAPTAHSIEGKLLACCAAELKADVLIAGHHGSKTSSRTAFLDAVGAKLYIISSGPARYATVTLPDQEVVTDFERRGSVFRTDVEDDACTASPDKVGSDSDGKAGGCDNIVITLPAAGPLTTVYRQISD